MKMTDTKIFEYLWVFIFLGPHSKWLAFFVYQDKGNGENRKQNQQANNRIEDDPYSNVRFL